MDYFKRWSASRDEFNEVFSRNPSLMGMMKGYMAEEKLKQNILEPSGVKNLRSPDDHDRTTKGDWVFDWDGEEIIVEVKCLQSHTVEKHGDVWKGKYQCDASDSREIQLNSGQCVETTLLEVGEFDILAVGLFDFGGEWNFVFAENEDLPRTTYTMYSKTEQNSLIKGTHSIEYPLSDDSIYSENIFKIIEP